MTDNQATQYAQELEFISKSLLKLSDHYEVDIQAVVADLSEVLTYFVLRRAAKEQGMDVGDISETGAI